MSDAGIAGAELSHRWHREPGEHYVEPQWCSTRLFDVEKFEGTIQDPFCGFGRIVDAATRAGHPAFGTDIVARGYAEQTDERDFLGQTTRVANIVGNPPFNIFKECALHALALAERKVALIWLVRTLPAARWLTDTPLAKILFLTPRPSMPPGYTIARGEKPKGGKQDFCWLVWDKNHTGAPHVGWLHRDRNSVSDRLSVDRTAGAGECNAQPVGA